LVWKHLHQKSLLFCKVYLNCWLFRWLKIILKYEWKIAQSHNFWKITWHSIVLTHVSEKISIFNALYFCKKIHKIIFIIFSSKNFPITPTNVMYRIKQFCNDSFISLFVLYQTFPNFFSFSPWVDFTNMFMLSFYASRSPPPKKKDS
jgi:hypothetical protein